MPSFDDILADFAFLDEWDDRYKYLIDLGRSLPPYPEDRRDDAHKVKGCASQVWLAFEPAEKEGRKTLVFHGDLEAVATLARARAQAVRDWLAGEGGVPGERIFVLEPKVEALGEGGEVQFSLR